MADIGLGPSFDPFADLAAEDAEKERKVRRPDRPGGSPRRRHPWVPNSLPLPQFHLIGTGLGKCL